MIRGDLKFFRNIRGEKAMRGNLDFKGGLKTLEETMHMFARQYSVSFNKNYPDTRNYKNSFDRPNHLRFLQGL